MKYLTVIRISVYHIFQNECPGLQKNMLLNKKHISVKSRIFPDNFSWCARLQLLLALWAKAFVFESGFQGRERLIADVYQSKQQRCFLIIWLSFIFHWHAWLGFNLRAWMDDWKFCLIARLWKNRLCGPFVTIVFSCSQDTTTTSTV